MANPFFSGRIPQELLDRVEKHVQDTGESKTNILVQALAAYLEFPIQLSNSNNSTLEKRLNDLEQKVTLLLGLDRNLPEIKQIIPDQNQTDNIVISNSDIESLDRHSQIEVIDNTVIDNDNSRKWRLIGEMSITEILKLPNLEIQDETKFRNMLKGLKSSKREKITTVGSYRIEIIGKEPGEKGKVIYRVFDNSDNKVINHPKVPD
jgi:hypothetical protein